LGFFACFFSILVLWAYLPALGMMMALTYPTFRRFKYPYLGLILIHPFIIEGVQFFMPGRTPDTADALVGLVGTLLGFCFV
jgi:VanZ family protein